MWAAIHRLVVVVVVVWALIHIVTNRLIGLAVGIVGAVVVVAGAVTDAIFGRIILRVFGVVLGKK